MVDFLQDVEEQLRSERFANQIRRAVPWVAGALALVIAAYLALWAYKAFQDRNLSAASLAYQNGVYALQKGDHAGALSQFQAAQKAGAPGYAALALMQEGDLTLMGGKAEAAARYFDQAAATAPNLVIGDLARLKAAQSVLDVEPLAQLRTRLLPLEGKNRPFAVYAKEALAMAELRAGLIPAARGDFSVLQLSLDAPQDVRQRAELAVAAIDQGAAAAAAAGASAAATMPPPAALNVPAAPSAPGAQGGAPATPAGAAS